jgi:tetratricopeptide (TPR) repeat protein
MISLAIAGTLAWTYLKSKAGEKLSSKAGELAAEKGGKIFSSLVTQFTENVPADNEQLTRAFHRSYLVATREICERLNKRLGKDNLPGTGSRAKNFLLGDTPTSLFGVGEKEWLDKVRLYVTDEIGKLEKDRTYLPPQSVRVYQTLILSAEPANDKSDQEFQQLFTKEVISELKTNFNEDPPESFTLEMERSWLDLMSNDFLVSISETPTLNNIFQNRTLATLVEGDTTIKVKLLDIWDLMQETRNMVQLVVTKLEAATLLADPTAEKARNLEKINELKLETAGMEIKKAVSELITVINKSMEVVIELSDENLGSKFGGYLGLAYFTIGEYELAIEKHARVINSIPDGQSHRIKSTNLTSKGNAHLLKGDIENALKCHEESMTILRKKREKA